MPERHAPFYPAEPGKQAGQTVPKRRRRTVGVNVYTPVPGQALNAPPNGFINDPSRMALVDVNVFNPFGRFA